MPPKSANRSGKSTPTKGQSRGGDKDKRKDDDDKQQQEEEEARLKAEQEEKERLEREQKEREELAKLEALEESRREQELGETEQKIRELKKYIEKLDGDRRANAMWERYMRCDGSPDPTVLKQINTFINLKKETGKPDINVILDEAKDIYELIDELKFLMEDTPAEEKNHETDEQYRSTILALQDLVMHRYGEGIMKILKEAIYEADSESGNLQKVIKGENEIIMLWGNLNKNPRFKSFTFEGENFAFELPKPLALADVAVRNLWSFRDHYSNQCSTFYPKAKKIKPTDEPADKKEEVKPEGEESEKLEVEQGEVAAADDEETKSTATDGRKSALSETAESEKKQEKEGEEEETNKDDASNPPVENQADEEEEEELDDILDEDVVDLRQFQQLGGIYHIDLIKLPPQPLSVKGWTLRQVIDEPMTLIEYPSEAFAPKPTSRAASAKDDARDTESPSKPQEQSQPPVTVIIMLPKNVMFFEEPQIANWDPIDSHWKTSGITDTTFDEENRSLTFKSRHFGTFCLTQDSHLNMPFQMWELRPLGLNHVLFTITAAIAETMIEIKGTQCRLQTPTDDPPTELEHLYEKWMCARDLKLALQTSGVNMFPAEDSHKFVSIQEKTLDLDGLYDQMALLSTSFAFSWSKWNSTVSKSQVVMQAAPWLGFGDAREKDTATPTYPPVPSPPTLSDDDWSEFYIDEKRSYKMAITELDDDFKSSLAPGAEYHSDFFHAVRDTPFPEPGPSQQGKPSRQKEATAPWPEHRWDDNWDKRKSRTFAELEDGPQKTCMKHYIFIRHGQYNTKGSTDEERSLTALGCEQANLTGKWLAQLKLNHLGMVQSTMTRAKETCSIISKHLPDVKVISSDLLREGAPVPPDPSNHQEESELKYFADSLRIESAFRKFVYRPSFKASEESIQIIVCHANVIRYFVCRALQFPPERWLRMSLRHGSVTWITLDSNGEVKVRCIGETGHMPSSKLS